MKSVFMCQECDTAQLRMLNICSKKKHSGKMSAHASEICDSSLNRLRMLTSIATFTPVTTIFFLLNKICDGGSSKEPFLKAATLSILI